MKADHYKKINKIYDQWEGDFGDMANQMFDEDEKTILAFINEEKRAAYKERKSMDWNNLELSIAQYLDTVAGDNWRTAFVPLLEGVMTDTSKQMAAAFGAQFNVQNIGSLQWFEEYTLTFAQDINETTKGNLSDLIQQGQYEGWSIPDFQQRMELMFKQWREGSTVKSEWDWYDQRMPAYRREMIARTETMRASNYGSYYVMQEAGVEKKEWLATGDKRTRPTHMDAWGRYSGKHGAIPLNQAFEVGTAKMMYPGDPAGGSEGISCRCTQIPFLDSSEINRQVKP